MGDAAASLGQPASDSLRRAVAEGRDGAFDSTLLDGTAVVGAFRRTALGGRTVVASPLYKQHFDLATGECLEAPAQSVRTYPVRVDGGRVLVARA